MSILDTNIISQFLRADRNF